MKHSLRRLQEGHEQDEWTFQNAAGQTCFVFVRSDGGLVRVAVHDTPLQQGGNMQPLFESVFGSEHQSSWYYLRAAIECIKGGACVCRFHDGAETPCCKRLQEVLHLMGKMYKEMRSVQFTGGTAGART